MSESIENKWFKDSKGVTCYGDIDYQRCMKPEEEYIPIPVKPDTYYVKYDNDLDKWVDDPEAKQEAIDNFVDKSMKEFIKVMYKNFDSLPAGMKTILQDWKNSIDEFKNNL